ncbi:HD domain-containing protein [Streptomyces sp. NK15101]|uniref:HD domain-containing protein n=1 Tax=Streptomyces sp. NK15101 TaxID=2873261 RepID=UPI001CED05F1|nr:HD domain-containing protein [Streptomyces sp. NK15101]
MTPRTAQTYAGFDLPATELAVAALRYAEKLTEPYVFRHSVRGYLFGRALATQRGLRPDADYNDELVFVASVLHDIGLSHEGNGDQRFEVDGADLAARFLRERGLPEDDVAIVWDAIALHTSDQIAARKGPEVALCQAGIAVDILGQGRTELPEGFADRLHTALPRENLAYALTDAIVAQARSNPLKAGPLSFPGALLRHRLPPRALPDWYDLIAGAGWGDRCPNGGQDTARSPRELAELFVRHLAAGDLDRLAGLYEPGAVFTPHPGTTSTGAESVDNSLRQYVKDGVRIGLELRRVHETGDLALLSSLATIDAPDAHTGRRSPSRSPVGSPTDAGCTPLTTWRSTPETPSISSGRGPARSPGPGPTKQRPQPSVQRQNRSAVPAKTHPPDKTYDEPPQTASQQGMSTGARPITGPKAREDFSTLIPSAPPSTPGGYSCPRPIRLPRRPPPAAPKPSPAAAPRRHGRSPPTQRPARGRCRRPREEHHPSGPAPAAHLAPAADPLRRYLEHQPHPVPLPPATEPAGLPRRHLKPHTTDPCPQRHRSHPPLRGHRRIAPRQSRPRPGPGRHRDQTVQNPAGPPAGAHPRHPALDPHQRRRPRPNWQTRHRTPPPHRRPRKQARNRPRATAGATGLDRPPGPPTAGHRSCPP